MDRRTSKSFLSRWRRSLWLRVVGWLSCLLLVNSLTFGTGLVPPDKPAYFPEWWFQRGVIQPLNPNNPNPSWLNGDFPAPDDFAGANIGQLKQMATQAAAEMNAYLPGGAGTTVNNLIAQWSAAPTSGVTRDDFAALNLGQLKAVAKPFYDQLIAAQYTNAYPWAGGQADDYSVANLGQLKDLFGFDLTLDSDGAGVPDWYQRVIDSNPTNPNLFLSGLSPYVNPPILYPSVGSHGGGGGSNAVTTPPVLDPRSPGNPGSANSNSSFNAPTLSYVVHWNPDTQQFDPTSIDLSMTNNATQQQYVLEKSIDQGGWYQIGVFQGLTDGMTDTGLLPPHTYYYRLRPASGGSNQAAVSNVEVYAPSLGTTLCEYRAYESGYKIGYWDFTNPTPPECYLDANYSYRSTYYVTDSTGYSNTNTQVNSTSSYDTDNYLQTTTVYYGDNINSSHTDGDTTITYDETDWGNYSGSFDVRYYISAPPLVGNASAKGGSDTSSSQTVAGRPDLDQSNANSSTFYDEYAATAAPDGTVNNPTVALSTVTTIAPPNPEQVITNDWGGGFNPGGPPSDIQGYLGNVPINVTPTSESGTYTSSDGTTTESYVLTLSSPYTTQDLMDDIFARLQTDIYNGVVYGGQSPGYPIYCDPLNPYNNAWLAARTVSDDEISASTNKTQYWFQHTQCEPTTIQYLLVYVPSPGADGTVAPGNQQTVQTKSVTLTGVSSSAEDFYPDDNKFNGAYYIYPALSLVGSDSSGYSPGDPYQTAQSTNTTLTYTLGAQNGNPAQVQVNVRGLPIGYSYTVNFNAAMYRVYTTDSSAPVSDGETFYSNQYTPSGFYFVPVNVAAGQTMTFGISGQDFYGNSIGSDSIVIQYQANPQDNNNNPNQFQNPGAGPAVPLDDASGPRYRKIALNGRPIPDGKPQGQAESDVQPEQTFVDALTLQLRHNVSDVYIPLSGSDLALTVNRNVQPEVWSLQAGFRPHEQPFRPFGVCWSSNLGAHVEIMQDPQSLNPSTAYVTDESGAVYTFVGIGSYYVPMPSSRHDFSACLTSFDGKTFTDKYGTTLTFEQASVRPIPNSSPSQVQTVLRPVQLTDRLGNSIVYGYSDNGFAPSSIQAQNAQGQPTGTIYLQYDSLNHVTDVWDPLGHHFHYGYTPIQYGGATGSTEYGLTSVTGPDGNTVQYSYNLAMEDPAASNSTSISPLIYYHGELSGITDPLGNTTQIGYALDHSRLQIGSDGLVHPQTGVPRNVSLVTLPGGIGTATFINNSQIRLSASGVVNGVPSIQIAGARGTQVIDAENHTTSYAFGGANGFNLDGLRNLTDVLENPLFTAAASVPTVIYYTTMAVTTDAGTETFVFNPSAGMALQSATDLSGNVTSYAYTEVLQPAGFLQALLTAYANEGFFGYYDDPYVQTNALGNTRPFAYGPFRQLAQVVDELGHTTSYGFDALGRRIQESASDGAKITDFQYGDYRFPGVATTTTIETRAGDPGWAVPLVTADQLDDSGRMATETTGPVSVSCVYDADGNRLAVTNGNGYTTAFQYDLRNRLTQVTFPGPPGQALPFKSFVYDNAGNKIRATDENGNATTFSYDNLNRLTEARRLMSSGDLVTDVTYNNVNSRTSVTNPLRTVTQITYDAIQRPTQVSEALGTAVQRTTSFQYGANSGGSVFNATGFKPTQITDPRSFVTTLAYDGLYRRTSTSVAYASGQSALTQFVYDAVSNLTQVTDALGKVTQMTYDELRRPLSVTSGVGTPAAGTVSMAYTGTGLKWTITDELSRQSEMQYDAAGRASTALGPQLTGGLRPQTTLVYDGASNVVSKTVLQSVGVEEVWTYVYDGRNRKVESVLPADPNGNLARILRVYDPVGNIVAVRDSRGNVTNNTYDVANRLLSSQAPTVTLANGTNVQPLTTFTYDANGNALTVTNPNANVTTNIYDALNRLTSTQDGAGITVQKTYDPVGNVTSVIDGKGQTTSFQYDGLGRNTAITNAPGASTTYTYDGVNKTGRTDARGWITLYGYDGQNRLTSSTSQSNPTDNRGYAYDVVGNLLAVAEPNKGGIANVAYTYDPMNRVETETSGGVTHAYQYDLAGNRIVTLYGGTQRLMESSYDALNRLTSINERLYGQSPQNGRVTSYSYDLAGNVIEKTLPNGDQVTMTYDALNRVGSVQGQAVPSGLNQTALPLYCYAQSYDALGNVTQIEETYANASANRTLAMTYDGANRLLTEQITNYQNAVTSNSYGYDSANNRTSRTLNGISTTYNYNNLNQLTSWNDTAGNAASYTYDANGNRHTRTVGGATDTYSYDTENRLIGLVKNTTNQPISFNYQPTPGTYTYAYDYQTRRVARNENGTATQVVFSGGTSVQEYATSGALTAEYVRGGDYGGGVGGILYTVRGNALNFTHYDGRGDVTTKTDGGGNVTWQASYEAFGTRTQEAGTTQDRQKANTKDEDPTGFLNEGMRYRDLETGTFITRDPAGFIDGPNLYAYVRQNPWTSFDPIGLADGPAYTGGGSGSADGPGPAPYTPGDPQGSAPPYQDPVSTFINSAGNAITDAVGNGLQGVWHAVTNPTQTAQSIQRKVAETVFYERQVAQGWHISLHQGTFFKDQHDATIDGLREAKDTLTHPAKAGDLWGRTAVVVVTAEVGGELDSGLAAETTGSVWDMNPFARGREIERLFGANLPSNFPTFDRFANGVATSIKSIDLGAASYQNAATLARTLDGYVDSVAAFNRTTPWAGATVDPALITTRQLQLVVPGAETSAQQALINAAASRAQGMGVQFIVTPFP